MLRRNSINNDSNRPSTSYGAIDMGPGPSNDPSNVRFRGPGQDEGGGEDTHLIPGNSTEQDSICIGVSDCCRSCWAGACPSIHLQFYKTFHVFYREISKPFSARLKLERLCVHTGDGGQIMTAFAMHG